MSRQALLGGGERSAARYVNYSKMNLHLSSPKAWVCIVAAMTHHVTCGELTQCNQGDMAGPANVRARVYIKLVNYMCIYLHIHVYAYLSVNTYIYIHIEIVNTHALVWEGAWA